MSLTNADLAPVPPERRTWTTGHFAALWIGMAVCITTYTLASGLIDQGMSWKEAILCVALGNTLVLIPMILNAHAGTKYGIPFPVFARASFGVLGANVPAILRALVACGWFGIQTWLGGLALYQLTLAIAPGLGGIEPPFSSLLVEAVGITPGQLLGFVVFWFANLWFILRGTESIKWLEVLAAPVLIATGLALLGWAWMRAGGFGPILATPSRLTEPGALMKVFAPGLTAMVGYWATLSLNIPDFTRYAKSQRDQALGQALGLPATMVLFSFVGVAVTSATPLIFGETIWDPVKLLGRVGGPLVTVVSMFVLSVATLTTNLAANVVSPANDFSNLAPSRISHRTGGIITAVLGAVILPWKLIETSQGYIFTWLVGYSALLGPIGGILIADYFLIRRRELVVDDLYRRGGRYEFSRGFNPVAMIALAVGVGVNVPGFLFEAIPSLKAAPPAGAWVPAARAIYTYAWFVGFGLAGAVYWGLTTLAVGRAGRPPRDPGSA